jgi:hypothetical protein
MHLERFPDWCSDKNIVNQPGLLIKRRHLGGNSAFLSDHGNTVHPAVTLYIADPLAPGSSNEPNSCGIYSCMLSPFSNTK